MTVVLNKFFITILIQFFFSNRDEEISAVNYERNLGKRRGGGLVAIGRKVFIKKIISSLPLLAMETAMNLLCNAFLPVARR